MRAHPQALVSRAEVLARSHELQVVAELLGLKRSQITQMKKRGWKEAISGVPQRPAPNDFAWMAGRMTFGELSAHYRAGNRTIARWLREVAPHRRSRKGDALRRDPTTGRCGWHARRREQEKQGNPDD